MPVVCVSRSPKKCAESAWNEYMNKYNDFSEFIVIWLSDVFFSEGGGIERQKKTKNVFFKLFVLL